MINIYPLPRSFTRAVEWYQWQPSIFINQMYGNNAGAIGEPERIIEIPDPVPLANPATPDIVPDSVPDYVPDTFPTPAPAEP